MHQSIPTLPIPHPGRPPGIRFFNKKITNCQIPHGIINIFIKLLTLRYIFNSILFTFIYVSLDVIQPMAAMSIKHLSILMESVGKCPTIPGGVGTAGID